MPVPSRSQGPCRSRATPCPGAHPSTRGSRVPAHLSLRRPRLPASSASCLQPRPSGARSKLSLSLRSSGSGRRLRVAPAGGALGGPEGAVEGGCTAGGSEACSGCPHSDMATPVAPPPSSSRSLRASAPVCTFRLLLAVPRVAGAEGEVRRTLRPSQEEVLLPARATGSPEKPRGAPAEEGGAGLGGGAGLRVCGRSLGGTSLLCAGGLSNCRESWAWGRALGWSRFTSGYSPTCGEGGGAGGGVWLRACHRLASPSSRHGAGCGRGMRPPFPGGF